MAAIVAAVGSHHGGEVRQRERVIPNGDSFELCGGLHLPASGHNPVPKMPSAPQRYAQETVLRFASACQILVLPYIGLGCSPYKAADRSRPGARPVNPRNRALPRGRCAPLFRGIPRSLFGVDGPPSTGCDRWGLVPRGRKEVAT